MTTELIEPAIQALEPLEAKDFLKQHIFKQNERELALYGVMIAVALVGAWGVNLCALLMVDLAHCPSWIIPFAIVWQMFLYTGLFITGHDAMHGLICPINLKINHLLGGLSVLLYGMFSYDELLKKHRQHHSYPATDRDPDFHDGQHKHPVFWYLHFMRGYGGWQQFIGFSIAYLILHYGLKIPQSNLILFWAIPPILSSAQLFYFGTYLTHKEPEEGYQNSHRAQTNPLPTFWSFITCYHFGYHHEHHEYPYIPWWQLPHIRSVTVG